MKRFFITLLLSLNLYADPKDPYALAVTEGEPASLIEGMVSAITGDLYFAEQDVLVQGYVPLHLPRYYVSGDGEGKFAGWSFLTHLKATFKALNATEHTIIVKDPNGAIFTFQGSGEEVKARYDDKVYGKQKHVHSTKFYPPNASAALGVTNTSQGEISGRTNLKNGFIKLDADGRHFTLYCPDGTMRYYKAHHKQKNFDDVFVGETFKHLDYLLQWEQFPAGHKIFYKYDSEDRVYDIRTTNPDGNKTYASATVHHLHKDPSKDAGSDIQTSDGQTLSYRFEPLKGKHHTNFLLRGVILPDAPGESINYQEGHSYCGPLVGQRSIAGGRYMNFDYYRPGKNYHNGELVKVKDRHDSRCLRVKTISAPVGSDGTLHLTHRFYYDPSKGYTDLLEIDNTYTRYEYALDTMRLHTISRYNASRTLVNSEKFYWNANGELLKRAFLDGVSNPFFSRSFEYDNYGNVSLEKFQGNLSGQSSSEVAYIRRDYSQDGRNLLLRDEDGSGKVTTYFYHPQATLLTTKLIYEGNQIKQREFYEYDSDLILVKEIIDDGSTSDKNNLTGVRTRKIKQIIPVPSGLYAGMPYVIEEKYWNGSAEILLKKTALLYTKGGRVSQQHVFDAKDVLRYVLYTEYDGLGRPVKETNALGQVATCAYDESGNKIFSQDVSGKATFLTYDYSNRPTSVKEVGQDKLEHLTYNFYDTKHNRTATIDHFGNATHFAYDNFGHLISSQLPPVSDAKGSGITPTLHFGYDGAGREVFRADAKGAATQTQYNARNQKTVIHHPDGTEERFIYNLDGTLRSYINQEGGETSYTYDVFQRKTSEKDPLGRVTTYIYDGFNLLSIIDPEGNTTNYTYDGAGRKISEENNGEIVTFAYDELGRLSRTQAGDLVTITQYDLLDRKIEERKEDLQGTLLFKEKQAYDAAGNVTCITHFIANKEEQEIFTHDSFGRLISKTDPLGHQTTIHYNESYVNALSQKVVQKTTTDPMGLQTIETYDANGQLVLTEIKNSKGTLCSQEQKLYDLNGNITSQVSTIFPTGKTVTTVWEYDLMNRCIQVTEAFGTPESKTTRHAYNKRGLLWQTIKPDGVVLERSYDACANLTTLTSSDKTISYAYHYNFLGQLIKSQDLITGTSTSRILDPKGRILEERLGSGLTLKNVYDSIGRRTDLILPDATFINYAYDALNLRKIIRKDGQGFMLYTHLYKEYDLSGNLLCSDLSGNLGEVLFNIDPLGRTFTVRSPYFSQQILRSDAVGNITELQTDNEKATFAYDDLYQLVEETGRFSHRYAFDSHNNRLQKDDQTYEHNALHQIADHSYDLNGNPKSHGDARLCYDALDRLISLQTPKLRIDFSYDSFHRRLSKAVYHLQNGTWELDETLFYIYDGMHEIGATDQTGRIVQLRILGHTPHAEIGSATAIELEGHPYAVISDLIGNTACLVSLQDHSAQIYLYSGFGESAMVSPTSTISSPWQFASKRLDAETGLIFYGRRYYDPMLGRWLTPDPKGFVDGMNLYAFILNNPLNEIDAYGLSISRQPPPELAVKTPFLKTPMVCPKAVQTKQIAPEPVYHLRIPGPLDEDVVVRQLYEKDGTPRKEHPFIRFEWGNGMGNTPADILTSARYLSKLLGKYNVHYVENPTEGFRKDLERFRKARKGEWIPQRIYEIAQEWFKHFARCSTQEDIVRICHSEGVLQTRIALSLVPPALRKRVHILAIAPSVCIPEEMCGSVLHLYSEKDVVPQLYALKEGRQLGQMHNFRMVKSQNKFTVMEHGIRDPVYKTDLIDELKIFTGNYGK